MELWDLFYANGTPAERDMRRGDAIPMGLFHIVCEVLVKHTDGTYLLMQRDTEKIGHPGMFEASVGGSAQKGEHPYECALRELREETGINADDLTFVFSHNNLINTIYYCYLCVTDCPKDSIVLQNGETIAYRWLDKENFLQFVYSSEFVPSQRERWLPYYNKL